MGEGVGEGDLGAEGIKRPAGEALFFVAQEKVGPVAGVDVSGRMVEELAASVGLVAGLGEGGLERFDFGMMNEVVRGLVASGGRGELSRKDGSPGGGTEDSCGVGVGEVDSAGRELVEVRRKGFWGGVVGPDPVVHVVDREEKDVGLPEFGSQKRVSEEKE